MALDFTASSPLGDWDTSLNPCDNQGISMKLFDSDLTPTLHLVRHFDVLAFSVCFYHADDQSGLHHSLGIDAPSPPSPPFPRIYTYTHTHTYTSTHPPESGCREPISVIWRCKQPEMDMYQKRCRAAGLNCHTASSRRVRFHGIATDEAILYSESGRPGRFETIHLGSSRSTLLTTEVSHSLVVLER